MQKHWKIGYWARLKANIKVLCSIYLIPVEGIQIVRFLWNYLSPRLTYEGISSYNIISTVTRKLAWEKQKNTIVVNTGFFKEVDQLYVRTINKDMEPMIKRGKDLGFTCGGKKEVLGALITRNQTEEFIEELKDFFKED